MGQSGKKQTTNGSNISQNMPPPSIWKILIYLILFLIVGFAWVWCVTTLLDGIALYNLQLNNPFYTHQYMASVPPPGNSPESTMHQILLNHLSLSGLFSTLLTLIEWKIGERLLTWTHLLLKKPAKKSWRYIKRIFK